jgi:hypothetical protein
MNAPSAAGLNRTDRRALYRAVVLATRKSDRVSEAEEAVVRRRREIFWNAQL